MTGSVIVSVSVVVSIHDMSPDAFTVGVGKWGGMLGGDVPSLWGMGDGEVGPGTTVLQSLECARTLQHQHQSWPSYLQQCSSFLTGSEEASILEFHLANY